jgi:Caspase domain
MRSLFSGLLALAVGLGVCTTPAWAQPKQVRIGLVAGNNTGKDPARSLRYAEEEVERIGELLKSAGEFDEIVTLRGATRGDVEKAMVRVRQRLEGAKAAGDQTLFLFYYSGHGDNEALEIGGDRLLLRDLRSYLEQLSAADVRVAFVDACQSGALTGVKGGKRAPGYEVRLADAGQVKGLAIVTSSTANEFSQESDDLRGSFFSQNIMAGLRGAADTSHDGQVTLSEVYQFAFNRTLANTAASLVGGQHPTYDYRMAGAGDVVLTRTRPRDARLAFLREAGVTYTVFSKNRGDVVAEVASNGSDDLYLAIPAGDYRVVRRTIGKISERTLALAPGSVTSVDPNGMVEITESVARSKGGELGLRSRLGAYAGVSSSVVPGSPSVIGTLALSYSYDLRSVALRLRGSMTSFHSAQEGYTSTLLRMSGDIDVLFPLVQRFKWSLQAGPTVGMPVLRQTDLNQAVSSSYGFAYGGVFVANARLYDRTYLSLNLGAGGEVFRLDSQPTHRASVSALLGGVFAF